MRVLVTGGTGFQGSHLVKALLQLGFDVSILNTPSDRSFLNMDRFGEISGYRIYWGSVTDPNFVEKVVRDHDLVYHLAVNIHVDESIGEPLKFYQTNIIGSFYILDACKKYNIPLVHISSCEVYGGCDKCQMEDVICNRRISEACPLKPQSPYAASKAASDLICAAHRETYGQKILVLRPGNVYGPGQRYGKRGAVIPIATRAAYKNEPIYIYGDGTQKRDFINVADVVRAYVFLGGKFLSGELGDHTYNIGTGQETSINSVVEKIVNFARSGSEIIHAPSRPGEVSSFAENSSRLLNLGFKPQIDIESGIRQYVEWFYGNEPWREK
jgi:dTDP-glucose 4,6-dehydratase